MSYITTHTLLPPALFAWGWAVQTSVAPARTIKHRSGIGSMSSPKPIPIVQSTAIGRRYRTKPRPKKAVPPPQIHPRLGGYFFTRTIDKAPNPCYAVPAHSTGGRKCRAFAVSPAVPTTRTRANAPLALIAADLVCRTRAVLAPTSKRLPGKA